MYSNDFDSSCLAWENVNTKRKVLKLVSNIDEQCYSYRNRVNDYENKFCSEFIRCIDSHSELLLSVYDRLNYDDKISLLGFPPFKKTNCFLNFATLAISDEDACVRKRGIRSLASREYDEVSELLYDLLKTTDIDVLKAAIDVLAYFGNKESIPHLKQLLDKKDSVIEEQCSSYFRDGYHDSPTPVYILDVDDDSQPIESLKPFSDALLLNLDKIEEPSSKQNLTERKRNMLSDYIKKSINEIVEKNK